MIGNDYKLAELAMVICGAVYMGTRAEMSITSDKLRDLLSAASELDESETEVTIICSKDTEGDIKIDVAPGSVFLKS